MTYILNLFGSGIRYWNCEIPIEQFEEMSLIQQKHKVEWEILFYNFDFLKHFGYYHWNELSKQNENCAFDLSLSNRVEIKIKSKFIARFRAIDLKDEETIFPLYDTIHKEIIQSRSNNFKHFTLIQFEKGLIGKYYIDTEYYDKLNTTHFNMDNLKFELINLNGNSYLSSIYYDEKLLKIKQNDSVVISSKVVF